MLNRIALRHFRGFKALDVELRPVTVFMGRNSSGKTSVLHAVRMALEALQIGFAESTPHADDDGWITVCWDHIVWDHARLYPISDWAEMFTGKETGEGTSLSVELGFDASDAFQEVHVKLSYARNAQLKMSVRVRNDSAVEELEGLAPKSKFRSPRLRAALGRGVPRAVFIPAFYGVTSAEEHRTWALVQREIGSGNQSRIVRNLVARLDGTALLRMNDFLQRSVGATLSPMTGIQDTERLEQLELNYKDTNGELELSSAGAGLINLVALYAAMEKSRPPASEPWPVLFLLDEPEAHLHPKLQGDVGDTLGAMAAEFGAQLLIATHSVEMINRIGRRRDARLVALDRASGQATSLSSEEDLVRELGQWCDLTPFASLNFLASRRVLFHEGPSDDAILRALAELAFRSDAPKLAAFRAWTRVSLEGTGNASAQGVLGAVLTPTLFPALKVKETVRAVCVFDRDAHRTPGLRPVKPLTKGHFEAFELVWSRYSIESLFLEPGCLAGWLARLLPPGSVPEEELRRLVAEGISRADKDPQLLDEAEALQLVAKLRPRDDHGDGGRKQMTPSDALKAAKAAVHGQPEVWQKGKERARFVLGHVRKSLSAKLQSHLPTRLDKLIETAAADRLGDPAVLVPSEIRELLDLMVKP
jgi:hypothetical protein